MTYEFKISKSHDSRFINDIQLNDDYFLNYSNQEYLTDISVKDKRLICFGYLFDIRNPESSTEKTLNNIIKYDSFIEDVAYLNGQYLLIHIENDYVSITVDATSLVPVYINEKINEITNLNIEDEQYSYFNSKLIYNLSNQSTFRITFNKQDDDEKESFIELLKNQFRYFTNKSLVINFKSNNYMKALISVTKPALYGNFLIVDFDSISSSDKSFVESIRKDFNLQIIKDSSQLDNIFYLRNQLMDFKQFSDVNKAPSRIVMTDSEFSELSKREQTSEINLLTRKRNQSKKINETGLLYDPFNSHIIIQKLSSSSTGFSNISNIIINEMLPSMNYYDFVNGRLLKETNNELLAEIENLKQNQITSKNEQFLMNTKMSYFKVTENLDGKLKNDEILVYPATQNIEAEEKFIIHYENPGEGLIMVKSFFSNFKNGQTIIVNIDNKKYTINELHKGIFFDVKSKMKITMQYKKNRNSLPWQKAGTLLIKKNY